jgi:(p)ppGpp synthase/HD superfamily hydrolase
MKGMEFLLAAENRASFFRRISFFYPETDFRYRMIERAYNTAKDEFRDIRRDSGERYFEHLRAVALIMIDYLFVNDHELIVAGLLHDIVEDIPSWTLIRVEREFGLRVGDLLGWVSKPPVSPNFNTKEERDLFYLNRFSQVTRESCLIKLSDNFHNLSTLWECSEEKKQRKIQESKMFYLPMAKKHLILAHELMAALSALESGQRI